MRLPLLPGLLEAAHAECMRARQRRVLIADHPGSTLMALKSADETIDRVVRSCALYGQEAHDHFESAIGPEATAERSAAVFLRIALAVHTRSPSTVELATCWAGVEPRAVLEAMWYFPAPGKLFGADVDHVEHWFEHVVAHAPSALPLAIELAGRADARALLPAVCSRTIADGNLAAARLATVRLGGVPRQPGAADAPIDWRTELEIAACNPRQASDSTLWSVLQSDVGDADLAWAVLSARHPRSTFERLDTAVDADVRWRVIASTGYVDGVVAACAAVAESDGRATAAQRDVFELALGGVPAEVRLDQGERQARSAALRALLLKALRRAHVRLHNDADRSEWSLGAIVVEPQQAARVRLRQGTALLDAIPALGPATLNVTHALRQWLYVERAACSGQHLSLSAMDVSRRQEDALMVADVVDELRDR